jgi:hypothetical protein
MLGKRSAQYGMFEADHLYLDYVGQDTFYGFLASVRGQLFRDEDFESLYCADNGRASVPPSLLATALLLQTYDKVSDEEAKARADFDIRWKVALGIGIEERPFAKSTLQLFRAHLVLHDHVRAVFERSLWFARETGYLKSRKIKAVLDTSYIIGRGAVKDTYNLLSDGIVALARALAQHEGQEAETWASACGLSRYFGTSLKGEAGIDWDDPTQRRQLLGSIVADADGLLEMTRVILSGIDPEDEEHQRLREAAGLLSRLLMQDIERRDDGAALKEGVSRDRLVSVHDPEMRHGRKSAAKRFDGHKAAICVDPESQLICAVEVLPGNAQDHEQALKLVEQTEASADVVVEETVGDCAFGDGDTRKAFAEAGRKLVAKVPNRSGQAYFPKQDFRIDLQSMSCVCPAGHECRTVVTIGSKNRYGAPLQAFRFDAALCDACPLRSSCVRAKPGRGRTVMLHPQEALLQQARAFQNSPEFAPYRKLRQVAEHRLARLMQLGMRKARYFGRTKTRFQLLMAATVANLTLIASRACRGVGLMWGQRQRPAQPSSQIFGPTLAMVLVSQLSVSRFLTRASHASHNDSFRPNF